MAWTETTRKIYARKSARYSSDLTDREWESIAPHMPLPRRLGRPRKADLREVMNAILYVASTGCQWRMLPKDFPPCSTVQRYFYNGGRCGSGRGSIITWSRRLENWREKRLRPQPELSIAKV